MKPYYFVVVQLLLALAMPKAVYAVLTPEMSFVQAYEEIVRIRAEYIQRKSSGDPQQTAAAFVEISQLFDSIQLRIESRGLVEGSELMCLREAQFFISSALFMASFEGYTFSVPARLNTLILSEVDNEDDSLKKDADDLRRATINLYALSGRTQLKDKEMIQLRYVWLNHTGFFERRNIALRLQGEITVYFGMYPNIDPETRQMFTVMNQYCIETIQTHDAVDQFTND